ncbi:MAG: BamA/TamA family outer membrane protein, partial [Bacteroidales bacterium]|nr:BamA/TamA family outer membrane protein [Bacteroidales bacterium]
DSSVTPYSATKQYRSGNMYTKTNIEIRYPLLMETSAQVFGIGFIEAGNAWSEASKFNPFDLKRSAGFGVRAFLPMFGILGIEWGYGFDEVPGGAGSNGGQFQFSIGQQF